jgi:uncharacterized protein (TIGR00255 family)
MSALVRSMTGYGAAAAETDSFKASITVRSVNHRYLDVSVHLPRRFLPLEGDLRRGVQSRVERGRVDVAVHASLREAEGEPVTPNRPLIAGLVRALREVQADHGLAGELRAADLMRFPGAFEVQEAAGGVDDARRDELLGLLGRALDGLEQMRVAEGRRLEQALRAALDAVAAVVGRIEARVEQERPARLETLRERARVLLAELAVDESRLYQELVRMVDRQDVTEELQRLRSHVGQARDILDAAGAVGKRLDFLAQELGREANTIGSKSDSAGLAQEVVGLKAEIERFREQVQNVE